MNGPRILVVDDEAGIRQALRQYLAEHGYRAVVASSGEEAIEAVEQQRPDVILLDLVMPGIGGLEACKQIRARSSVPIIVLSVMSQEHDKVQALESGADDYVTKPFGAEELLARIGVALRHRAGLASGEEPIFQSGDLVVDVGRRLVTLGGEELRLTPIEYDVLRVLASSRGRIVTHSMLLAAIWGPEHEMEIHLLRFAVFQLRKKLGENPLHPKYIFTETGIGYRFGKDAG
jgi:two-component system, OmpR family, KDP operon response regulator KdpE